eukprot:628428-Hanusia_phi.AAC.1
MICGGSPRSPPGHSTVQVAKLNWRRRPGGRGPGHPVSDSAALSQAALQGLPSFKFVASPGSPGPAPPRPRHRTRLARAPCRSDGHVGS